MALQKTTFRANRYEHLCPLSEAAAGGPSKRDDGNEDTERESGLCLRWLGMHA